MMVTANTQRYACTNCGHTLTVAPTHLGGAAERARADGWKLGTDVHGNPVSYCPGCVEFVVEEIHAAVGILTDLINEWSGDDNA